MTKDEALKQVLQDLRVIDVIAEAIAKATETTTEEPKPRRWIVEESKPGPCDSPLGLHMISLPGYIGYLKFVREILPLGESELSRLADVFCAPENPQGKVDGWNRYDPITTPMGIRRVIEAYLEGAINDQHRHDRLGS